MQKHLFISAYFLFRSKIFSLHYANVSVGTPSLWFLVALDTGSDLLWLPCDCSSCVLALRSSSGQVIELLPSSSAIKGKTILNTRKISCCFL